MRTNSVIDPAGGSWAIEWLTEQVCKQSWACFQAIEAEGGMVDALASGYILEEIGRTDKANRDQLNQRRVSLIGTNVYPNLEEAPLEPMLPDYAELRDLRAREVADARTSTSEETDKQVMQALEKIVDASCADAFNTIVEAFRSGATLGEITRTIRANATPAPAITPLASRRLAEGYETLRAASAKFAARTGSAPKIFLTNLGPLRRHKLRADFTKGFFAAGGFEILSPAGFNSPEEAVAALTESEAGITVVCGTDDDYAEKFAGFAKAIKAALPEVQVILAGYPGEHEAAYREAGMDDYIFVKSNNYEVNRRYLQGLGVL